MSWTWALPPEGLNLLLSFAQDLQLLVRALWHTVGLTADIQGQPAWPFGQRIAGEVLAVDAGHARRIVLSLACLLGALLAVTVSVCWRRARPGLWILAVAALLLAPWPEAHLLLAPAVPTSLHQSPAGFTAQGIVRGQSLYQQYCLRCHGTDGRGEGPDAAQLPMWPPTLNGSLLWKRLEGELFWRVRHGMTGRDSRVTMPGFAAQLSDAQVWDLLDFLQANASGQTLKESGVWTYPVRLPDAAVQCRDRHHTVRSLAGQRLLVAVAGPNFNMPADDPRLVTLQTGLPPTPLVPSDPECRVDLAEFTAALSLVLGVPAGQLEGQQLLTDKQGWLRARGQPGQAAWSEDDLICRTTAMMKSPSIESLKTPTIGDGLDGLLRRMDAEPVRWLRGGFPH